MRVLAPEAGQLQSLGNPPLELGQYVLAGQVIARVVQPGKLKQLAIAYKTAGFTAKHKDQSALALYRASRVQDRCAAILKARAAHGPVSLSEVTDMLKRVYAGAIHSGEYTPAHNAAFSLARLHGLIIDRAQLDVVRRPSREPDAPSEIALSDWIQRLPGPDHATGPPAIGNGAPADGVTGTPSSGGRSEILDLTPNGSDLDPPPLPSIGDLF